ncbi:MAG: heme exporter protein CcmB [Dehalogenimonas sp.]
MNSSINKIKAIVYKDIMTELRTREVIFSVLVFSVLVIVVFSFAFGVDRPTIEAVAPGVLWVAFAFAGVLALNRTFIPEKENGCLDGILSCPVNREDIFLGKMLSSLFFMLVIEAITLPLFALLFNLPVLSPQIIVVTILATIGFVAVGTLFSALAVNTRAREMILPILFLPVAVPLIISAVKATEITLAGGSWVDIATWMLMIIAFDAVFVTVSYLVFNYVLEE